MLRFISVTTLLVSALGMGTALAQAKTLTVEPTRRFIPDGNNLCARFLGASDVLGERLYDKSGTLSPEQIEVELNKRFPPFSWGQSRPSWIVRGHRETLYDIELILTEILSGKARREIRGADRGSLSWLQQIVPQFGGAQHAQAEQLLKVVKRMNPATASDGDMVDVLCRFNMVVSHSKSRTICDEAYDRLEFIEQSRRDKLPEFHLFFTLRPLDYLDIVGLNAAGIYPVAALTTKEGAWDGFDNRAGWTFTIHDLAHATDQLGKLIDFTHRHKPIPPLDLLRFEYDSQRKLIKDALARKDEYARLTGIGTLFELIHESEEQIFTRIQVSMGGHPAGLSLYFNETIFISKYYSGTPGYSIGLTLPVDYKSDGTFGRQKYPEIPLDLTQFSQTVQQMIMSSEKNRPRIAPGAAGAWAK